MNERISKETEIREVMKWQLLIAGAVDAAIRGTETYIRLMELSRQQTESLQIKSQEENEGDLQRTKRVGKSNTKRPPQKR